jgi:hypothetical protein
LKNEKNCGKEEVNDEKAACIYHPDMPDPGKLCTGEFPEWINSLGACTHSRNQGGCPN